jgi:hypothetical protein
VFFFFLWEKKVIYVAWVLATRKKKGKEYDALMYISLFLRV